MDISDTKIFLHLCISYKKVALCASPVISYHTLSDFNGVIISLNTLF